MKRKKQFNGAGTVSKLSGKRKKPYIAYSVSNDYKKVYLGTFKTQTEARKAISEFSNITNIDYYNITFSQAFTEWSETHFKNVSDKTMYSYNASLEKANTLHHKRLRDIRTNDFQNIINEMEKQKYSRSAIEKVLQLFSQLCKFGMENECVNQNYAQFVRLPKIQQKTKRIFTKEEVQKILNSDNEICKIATCLIFTGCRVNELLNMKTEDVHLGKNYMIGGSKTEAGKNRIIPIHPLIKKYIEEWYKQAGLFLIPPPTNKTISFRTDTYGKMFKETMHALGIEGVTTHCCRHTHATMLANAGLRPETISRLLGHSSYDTSQIYIHSDIENLIISNSSINLKNL